jgi:cytochrome b6-f complex iron-sulfur subunit
MNEQNRYTRKDFLRTAGSTALFATLGIGFYGCGSSTDAMEDTEVRPPSGGDGAIEISNNGNTITIDLSVDSVSGLNQQGGWILIRNATTLAVNVDGSTIRAFTSVCTHAGCSTNWQFSNSNFECTCHGSRFDTSGSVVRGPATGDLREYTVVRDGDLIVISK